MKKYLLVCFAAVMVAVSGCYKDDIDDLNKKYDKLLEEQQKQAETLANYQTLLNALNNKLTVSGLSETESGYVITFSDGSTMNVNHGVNGTDAPAIVSVEELNGQVSFYLSDGTVITLHRIETVALYILSEGSWGSSNSDFAYYDFTTATLTSKYYSAKNGSTLGDTGNDLKLYGSKMYCVVSGQSMTTGGSIKVINPVTGELIEEIPATDADGNPDQPRRIAVSGGKVYVTMYSGSVACIDTTSLEITNRASLSGAYPEGICAYNGNLYICNSGQGSGNTISVVNIGSFTETSAIEVAMNPVDIGVTSAGDIYFTTADNTWGGGDPSNLYKFNVSNPESITNFNIRAGKLAIGKDYVYTIDTDWDDYSTVIKKVNLKTNAVSDFIIGGLANPWFMGYNISVNPTNGDVYLLNMGEDVYVYDSEGNFVNSLSTGTGNGSTVVFINK